MCYHTVDFYQPHDEIMETRVIRIHIFAVSFYFSLMNSINSQFKKSPYFFDNYNIILMLNYLKNSV